MLASVSKASLGLTSVDMYPGTMDAMDAPRLTARRSIASATMKSSSSVEDDSSRAAATASSTNF